MRNNEFYRKYKTTYAPSEKLTAESWWQIISISIAAVLIEPFIVYKNLRHIPFSRTYYLQQVKYFLWISIPLFLYQVWVNWQESVKRNRGYCWIGRFEVVRKRNSFTAYQLILTPGKDNRLKVKRTLFNQLREGDSVMIRRDALGKIEHIIPIKNLTARLAKSRTRTGRSKE